MPLGQKKHFERKAFELLNSLFCRKAEPSERTRKDSTVVNHLPLGAIRANCLFAGDGAANQARPGSQPTSALLR